jgi:hypothetical protein
MSALKEAPTTERGSVSGRQTPLPGIPGWTAFYGDDLEHVPELMWPQSVSVLHQMRSDSQVKGLYLGATLPIRRYAWWLDPNGAKPEVVTKVADNYGLRVRGQEEKPKGRTKGRFAFGDHLRLALLGLMYGHYYFEQVGEIRDGQWWCKKLSERVPHSLSEINIAQDGMLESIRQFNTGPNVPPIDIKRLVAYVWDREGANWAGRSMFREAYKNWLVKDRTLRVGTVSIERNGAGVPVGVAPPGATPADIERINKFAQAARAGTNAGGSLPNQASLTFEGVRGALPDAAGWIRLQNEEMARSALEMFMQLGQTETGSRALGDSFIELFSLAQLTVAEWFKDIFNEHVIEDDVDWNFGEDEPAPLLTYDSTDPELSITDLGQLVTTGLIQVDEELENTIRERHKLPARTTPRIEAPLIPDEEDDDEPPEPSPTEARRESAGRRGVSAVAATSPLNLPARDLRRQPYDHEVRAATDFAEMDSQFFFNRDTLVTQVRNKQAEQIEELHDAIVGAGEDVGKLASIAATPNASGPIFDRMVIAGAQGATQALKEATEQNVKVPKLGDIDEALTSLEARAAAVSALLARSISETAARRAIRLTGGSLTPAEVAAEVRTGLSSLSTKYLEDQLGETIVQATNTGRKLTMRVNQPDRYYASALLDTNTCAKCVSRDGTQYLSLADAEADFPTGGYKDCEGGPRDRCTLVAIYEESEPDADEPFGGVI